MQKIIEAAAKRAGEITPVPGGVRPLTTVFLLRKTLVAAARRRGALAGKI